MKQKTLEKRREQAQAGQKNSPVDSPQAPILDEAKPAPAEHTESVSEDEPQGAKSDSPRWLHFARSLIAVAPTMAVLALLAALGLWGHHYGWKIPKFSELTAKPDVHKVAWCDEHGVPEADCIACNAELMPKGKLYGWCQEHGVHECLLDHPELAQLKEVPIVSDRDLARAAQSLALRPRKANDPTCKLHLRRIQFPSVAAADKAGIDIALVDHGKVLDTISTIGEAVYDPRRVAPVASRAAGTIRRVEKNVGDRVEQGDVLAVVEAAEVGRAKAELLQALAQFDLHSKTYDRLAELGKDVIAGSRLIEADAAKTEADVAVQKAIQALVNLGFPISDEEVRRTPTDVLRKKLHLLGLPPAIASSIDTTYATSNLLPVVAPRAGILVARDGVPVPGEVIETSRTLFTVADPSRMWIVLSVPVEEAKYVKQGQKIVFRSDREGREHIAPITWISTDVDTGTRTVMVRAELANDDNQLRNETFGAGEIVLREELDAVVVPSSSVHWEGCCSVVFVRDKDYLKTDSYKVFHTRSVRPGITMGDQTEMIAGLFPGEVIVTKGSDVLRAELLKGNLGAG